MERPEPLHIGLFFYSACQFGHELIYLGVADFYTFATQSCGYFRTQIRTFDGSEKDGCAGSYYCSAQECVK